MGIEKLILIGASTGGPGRIHTILSSLDATFNATIVIAQHMAAPFITGFTAQLQAISPLDVCEVQGACRLENATVYVCRQTSVLVGKGCDIWIEPLAGDDFAFNPQIDPLFVSAASLNSPVRAMGVILTGIGEDGAKGAEALSRRGAACYFENEESAIVYGMPRRAKELVPQGRMGSIDTIAAAINAFGGN